LRFKDRSLPCATNILVISGRGRRLAQAALELCGSSERRDFATFISSMSLIAELVACRTSTPWKSKQHRHGGSDEVVIATVSKEAAPGVHPAKTSSLRTTRAFHRRGPFDHSPSTRRRCSSRISSAMLVRESRTSADGVRHFNRSDTNSRYDFVGSDRSAGLDT
jgi:hypothetical protein